MTALAALAGALTAGGVLLLIRELTRREPPRGTPPGSRAFRVALSASARRRILPAAAAGIGVLLFTRWPVAGVAAASAVVFLPKVTMAKGHKQKIAVLEGLEQWTRRLADMLTASRGLEDALEASAVAAPPAVAGPVTALARRLSARTGTEAALRAFAAEINDPAGDRIAAALIIATGRRGGGVRNVLGALAGMLARDVAARRQVEADRAEHRTTLQWITGFIIVYTIVATLDRSYSAPFGTVLGEVVLAMVAGLYAAGLGWLHHLGDTPAAGRFLNAGHGRKEPAPAAARRVT